MIAIERGGPIYLHNLHNFPSKIHLYFQGCSWSFHRHEPQVFGSGRAIRIRGTRIWALQLGRERPRVLDGPDQGGARWGEPVTD